MKLTAALKGGPMGFDSAISDPKVVAETFHVKRDGSTFDYALIVLE